VIVEAGTYSISQQIDAANSPLAVLAA